MRNQPVELDYEPSVNNEHHGDPRNWGEITATPQLARIPRPNHLLAKNAAVIEQSAWCSGFLLIILVMVAHPFLIFVAWMLLGLRLSFIKIRTGSFGTAKFCDRDTMHSAGLLGEKGIIICRALRERPRFVPALWRLFFARWDDSLATIRNMRAAFIGSALSGTPLLRLPRYCHAAAISAPGGGKTTSLVFSNLLEYSGSSVIIDMKGEVFKGTAKVRSRYLKNHIIRLDPFQQCGPGGDSLNPLHGILADDPICAAKCANIAEAIVVYTAKDELHWPASAMLGITAASLYVVVNAPPAEKNLNTVAALLLDPTAFDGMIALMLDADGEIGKTKGNTVGYALLKQYGGMLSSWVEKERSSILSTIARNILAFMNTPLIAKSLARSTFDPRDLIRRKHARSIYLIIPPQYLASHGRLVRLWIATIVNSIFECGLQEEHGREVLFMLDEIGNCGPGLSCLYNAITIGRGFGIRCFLLLQSYGQFKTLFPDEGMAQTVESAIETKIVFGIRDYKTAEEISQHLGSMTIAVTSTTSGHGGSDPSFSSLLTQTTPAGSSTNWTKSSTESETGRRLLMPDEILRLPEHICLVLTKGIPPIKAQLAKYYECPELAKVLPEVNKPL